MYPSSTKNSSKETNLERSNLRTAFNVLDADNDGKISKEDLSMFYKHVFLGSNVDDDAIRTMISVADADKDGFVLYEEFEGIVARGNYNGLVNTKNVGVREEKEISVSKIDHHRAIIQEMFKVMDKDGDGKLSYGDLKSFMVMAGFDSCDEEIKAMIKLAGGDFDDNHHNKIHSSVSCDDLINILSLDNFVW